MTVQIIEIAGQKMAVLPVGDYERLLDAVEDRADADASDVALKRAEEGEEYIPAEMLDRILGGESALRVWREHRGMTLKALEAKAGVVFSTISHLEHRRRKGTPKAWRALAEALDVTVDDILPLD